MPRYTLQVRPIQTKKNAKPEFVLAGQIQDPLPYDFDYYRDRPQELEFFERCYCQQQAGHGVLYILGCQLLSMNGLPIPMPWHIMDMSPDHGCDGDALIVRSGLTAKDFGLEFLK